MIYDFLIVGGGPTGLALSTMLSQTDASIALLEKDVQLGGCWKVDWVDDKYYSEHSPRVMTTKYNKFRKMLELFKIDFQYSKVYKDRFTLHKKLFSMLSFTDMLKLLSGLIITRFFETQDTVEDFMLHLTTSGSKALYMLAVAVANIPSKVMMQDVFDEMLQNHGDFIHLKDSESWYKVVEQKLSPRVDIRKQHGVQSISRVDDIFYVKCAKGMFTAKEVILAVPPIALTNILKYSDKEIKNNWGNFEKVEMLANKSSYHSIGFQLHFDKVVPFPKDWCKYCEGDWNMILLPVSNYLQSYSRDPDIKCVWSGCIVDQSGYSRRLGKHAGACTMQELQSEILLQLKVPTPKVFTFTQGLTMGDGQYTSKDTGFIRTIHGTVPPFGKLPNLYAVGPINHSGIVTMESAIEDACEFILRRYPASDLHKTFDRENSLTNIALVSAFVILFMLMMSV